MIKTNKQIIKKREIVSYSDCPCWKSVLNILTEKEEVSKLPSPLSGMVHCFKVESGFIIKRFSLTIGCGP